MRPTLGLLLLLLVCSVWLPGSEAASGGLASNAARAIRERLQRHGLWSSLLEVGLFATIPGPGTVAISTLNLSRDAGQQLTTTCGGVLITPGVVLTAAHCVVNPVNTSTLNTELSNLRIVVGGKSTLNGLYNTDPSVFTISSYAVHASFADSNNDIAVFFLSQCVASPTLGILNDLPDLDKEGTLVDVLSYGVPDCANRPAIETVFNLKKTSVKELDTAFNQHCQAEDEASHQSPTTLCYGPITGNAASINLCSGDSGSPGFALDSKGRGVVVGLISRGMRELGQYANSRVSKYKAWVNGAVAKDKCSTAASRAAMWASHVATTTPAPTLAPKTEAPIPAPTTAAPTEAPTSHPTEVPTEVTEKPTAKPTEKPTEKPTPKPTTLAPTQAPTAHPTAHPTATPTQAPTALPTRPPVSVTPELTHVPEVNESVQVDFDVHDPQACDRDLFCIACQADGKCKTCMEAYKVDPNGHCISITAAPASVPTEAPTTVPTAHPTIAPTAAPTPKPKPTSAPTPEPTKKPTVQIPEPEPDDSLFGCPKANKAAHCPCWQHEECTSHICLHGQCKGGPLHADLPVPNFCKLVEQLGFQKKERQQYGCL